MDWRPRGMRLPPPGGRYGQPGAARWQEDRQYLQEDPYANPGMPLHERELPGRPGEMGDYPGSHSAGGAGGSYRYGQEDTWQGSPPSSDGRGNAAAGAGKGIPGLGDESPPENIYDRVWPKRTHRGAVGYQEPPSSIPREHIEHESYDQQEQSTTFPGDQLYDPFEDDGKHHIKPKSRFIEPPPFDAGPRHPPLDLPAPRRSILKKPTMARPADTDDPRDPIPGLDLVEETGGGTRDHHHRVSSSSFHPPPDQRHHAAEYDTEGRPTDPWDKPDYFGQSASRDPPPRDGYNDPSTRRYEDEPQFVASGHRDNMPPGLGHQRSRPSALQLESDGDLARRSEMSMYNEPEASRVWPESAEPVYDRADRLSRPPPEEPSRPPPFRGGDSSGTRIPGFAHRDEMERPQRWGADSLTEARRPSFDDDDAMGHPAPPPPPHSRHAVEERYPRSREVPIPRGPHDYGTDPIRLRREEASQANQAINRFTAMLESARPLFGALKAQASLTQHAAPPPERGRPVTQSAPSRISPDVYQRQQPFDHLHGRVGDMHSQPSVPKRIQDRAEFTDVAGPPAPKVAKMSGAPQSPARYEPMKAVSQDRILAALSTSPQPGSQTDGDSCPICSTYDANLKRHVIKNHLPWYACIGEGYYAGYKETVRRTRLADKIHPLLFHAVKEKKEPPECLKALWGELLFGLVDYIKETMGFRHPSELVHFVRQNKLYPSIVELDVTEVDRGPIRAVQAFKRDKNKAANMSPPDHPVGLLYWKTLAKMIGCLPESFRATAIRVERYRHNFVNPAARIIYVKTCQGDKNTVQVPSSEHIVKQRPPFQRAIQTGDLDSLYHLTRTTPNLVYVKFREVNGGGPVAYAISLRQFSAAAVLMVNGASVDQQDLFGMGPLHRAAKAGNLDAVKFLLRWDPTLYLRSNSNFTALELAQQNSHDAVVKEMRKAMATHIPSEPDPGKVSREVRDGMMGLVHPTVASGRPTIEARVPKEEPNAQQKHYAQPPAAAAPSLLGFSPLHRARPTITTPEPEIEEDDIAEPPQQYVDLTPRVNVDQHELLDVYPPEDDPPGIYTSMVPPAHHLPGGSQMIRPGPPFRPPLQRPPRPTGPRGPIRWSFPPRAPNGPRPPRMPMPGMPRMGMPRAGIPRPGMPRGPPPGVRPMGTWRSAPGLLGRPPRPPAPVPVPNPQLQVVRPQRVASPKTDSAAKIQSVCPVCKVFDHPLKGHVITKHLPWYVYACSPYFGRDRHPNRATDLSDKLEELIFTAVSKKELPMKQFALLWGELLHGLLEFVREGLEVGQLETLLDDVRNGDLNPADVSFNAYSPEEEMMFTAHQMFTGAEVKKVVVSPPDRVSALLHWKTLGNLIACLPEASRKRALTLETYSQHMIKSRCVVASVRVGRTEKISMSLPSTKSISADAVEKFGKVMKSAHMPLLFSLLGADPSLVYTSGYVCPTSNGSYTSGPVLYALAIDQLMVAKVLMTYGASPDQLDSEGWTPVQRMAWMGKLGNSKLLLSWGANPLLANPAGNTASQISRTRNFAYLADLIDTWAKKYKKPKVQVKQVANPKAAVGVGSEKRSAIVIEDEAEDELLGDDGGDAEEPMDKCCLCPNVPIDNIHEHALREHLPWYIRPITAKDLGKDIWLTRLYSLLLPKLVSGLNGPLSTDLEAAWGSLLHGLLDFIAVSLSLKSSELLLEYATQHDVGIIYRGNAEFAPDEVDKQMMHVHAKYIGSGDKTMEVFPPNNLSALLHWPNLMDLSKDISETFRKIIHDLENRVDSKGKPINNTPLKIEPR